MKKERFVVKKIVKFGLMCGYKMSFVRVRIEWL